MSTTIAKMYQRYLDAHGVDGLEIPCTAAKFYKHGDEVPGPVAELETEGLTLTSCQATKQSMLGDAVFLTRRNIGCVAASISLGLADQNDTEPLGESTVYTDIMKSQAKKQDFRPPSPNDFTVGTVYACAAAGRSDFGLFGPNDSGRFRDIETSRRAVSEMIAIQPATTRGLFLYSPAFTELDIIPDVVVLSVRPVELTRLIQGYWFSTGERINASMGGLRMVNSDLLARPHLTGEINVSPYCLGARLIAEFGPDRMGVGLPWEKFVMTVEGMEASRTGYPFQSYPGAQPADSPPA
jgi:uncharacterized protein (DUF169 family)